MLEIGLSLFSVDLHKKQMEEIKAEKIHIFLHFLLLHSMIQLKDKLHKPRRHIFFKLIQY